jgi:hypothetical protein
LVGRSLDGSVLLGASDGRALVGSSLDGRVLLGTLVGSSLVGRSLDGSVLLGASDGRALVGSSLDGSVLLVTSDGRALVGSSLDGRVLLGSSLDGRPLVVASVGRALEEVFTWNGRVLVPLVRLFKSGIPMVASAPIFGRACVIGASAPAVSSSSKRILVSFKVVAGIVLVEVVVIYLSGTVLVVTPIAICSSSPSSILVSIIACLIGLSSGSSGNSSFPMKLLSKALSTVYSVSYIGRVNACKTKGMINNFLVIEYMFIKLINF